tara:strand:- start:5708 stop:6502 length:795 start_codon:yes stop_codon:yes gene_type:complete
MTKIIKHLILIIIFKEIRVSNYKMKQYTYISIDLNGSIGEQLFQIAEIYIFKKVSKIKRKVLIKKDDNKYLNTIFKNVFKTYSSDKYDEIKFISVNDNDNGMDNIKLLNYNRIFDNDIKEIITNIVYKNEDLMYAAYFKYRDIIEYFGKNTKDEDLVAIDYNSNYNKDFYVKALEIFNKEKLVIFGDLTNEYENIFSKDKYKIYCVKNIDKETEFILYSMFKYNLISDSLNLLWSSYISHYENKKIVVHNNLKNISNQFVTHYL